MATNYRSPNRVDVFCNKPVYVAGDIVEGYILLTVFESFTARSVNVEVIGFESVQWNEIRVEEVLVFDGADEIITKIPRHARKDFFEVDVPLYQWYAGQLLAPGQYQFPFRILLPPNLPGSFRFEDESYESDVGAYESVVAKVEYKLKGFVMLGGMQNVRCPHMHDSVEIVVMQRCDRPPHELTAETVKQVNSCCFFQSAGMVVVRLRAAKDRFGSGEVAEMVLEIENHTNLEFDEVWVELDRVVVVKARGCSYRSEERLCRRQFPGLPKGTSYVGAGAKRLSLPLPDDLEPTTVSSLVTCSYRVWVQLSAGPFTSHPRLQVPISVHGQPPRRQVQAPVGMQQQQQQAGGAAPFGAVQTFGQAVVVNLPCNGLPAFQGSQPQQPMPQPPIPQQVAQQVPAAFATPQPAVPAAPAYVQQQQQQQQQRQRQRQVDSPSPFADASAPPAPAASVPAVAAPAHTAASLAGGQDLLGSEGTAGAPMMNPMYGKPV